MKDRQGRIVRWLLILQEFTFEPRYRPGSQNNLADQLSRVHRMRKGTIKESLGEESKIPRPNSIWIELRCSVAE